MRVRSDPPFERDCIRRFTATVAAEVAAAHARDPLGELRLWLHMALRREASVGEIYGPANLGRRLARVRGREPIVAFLGKTIANIWAQEKAHAAYLEAMLGTVAGSAGLWRRLAARADSIMGAIEGHVLSSQTSPSLVARGRAALVLAVGRRVEDVPGFVATLPALGFSDFCLLNAELEITAVHGYERMIELLRAPAADAGLGADSTLGTDVARMIADERFHNEAFLAIAGWFGPSGEALRADLALEDCVRRIGAIRADIYCPATLSCSD